MRLNTIKYLLLFVSIFTSLTASAIEVNGIYYSVNSSTNEAEVTYKDANYNSYSGYVVIPDKFTYNGVEYTVTAIGPHAFQECTSLTSVSIPNSVTLFNDYAFYNCSGLTEVTIPNSVMEIGYRAFSFCSSLTSVAIPNSVTRIRSYAFLGCSSLTSVTIPNSVTNIGSYAFQDCNNLASIQITDLEAWCNITYTINPFTNPYHLYLNGEEIKDLVIPNSVTSIGNNAFFRCIGLTSVTIPNSVTTIGASAFSGCSGLTEIYSKISEPFKTSGCWSDVNKTIPLYVPIGSKAKYQSTDGWKDFKNIIETEFAPTGVEVNATNFPDEAFRSWVLQNVSGASDGLLTDDEIAEVTSIDCSNKGIYSLQGIEFFTALTELNLYANRLASLNISKNSSLRKLHCQSNQLKTLELSKNMSLTRLDCNGNQLVTLELVNNTELTDLNCDDNKLTSLNVSKNNKLISLSCTNNLLFQLDLSTNNSLQIVRVSPQSLSLTAVDVTSGVAIPVPTDFDLEKVTNLKLADSTVNGSIASIGGQKYLVFAKLGASQSAIDGKDLTYTYNTGNSKAELMDVTVTLSYTAITPTGIEVNATNFPDEAFRNWVLQNVSGASDGILTDEEIAKVTGINCSGSSPSKPGKISSLKGIEFFTALTSLVCSSNQLTGLDVSKNTALTSIVCSSNQLTSLDVSNNTALTYLACSSNQLTTLDVSCNAALTYLECLSNQLTVLDVHNNTSLKTFVCYSNQLTALDLNNNTALTTLYCDHNQLTYLDVSKNTALTSLTCNSNQLASLDVSKNTELATLNCSSNQLTSLDVSQNTALTLLKCGNNHLLNLDLSNNNSINSTYTSIDSQSISLTAVDISSGIAIPVPSDFDLTKVLNLKLNGTAASGSVTSVNGQNYLVFAPKGTAQSAINGKKLTYTYSTGNSFSQAASMDVTVTLSYIPTTPTGVEVNATNFPDEAFRNWVLQNVSGASDGVLTDEEIARVTSINCSGDYKNRGRISSLQGIEFFTALTSLDCSYNQVTSLDVITNTALTYLNCVGNKLTYLDVSKNTALINLYCSSNQLTALDVSKNTSLNRLYCEENQLTSLDVSNNTAMMELYCNSNQLSSLDMSQNTGLTNLSCYSNQLTSLDVSQNLNLTYLNCYSNQLTSLDVSKNTALKELYCTSNQLTSLDVSTNTALTTLSCGGNQLTSLDVSTNTALTALHCESNQLTSLDVSKNTALGVLYCESNQLTSLDVSKITYLRLLYCYSNQLLNLDLSNNTYLTNVNDYFNRISPQSKSLVAVGINSGIAIPVPIDFNFTKVSNLKLNGTSVNGSVTTVGGLKYLVFAQTGTAQSVIDGKNLTYTYSTGNSLSDAASMDVTVMLSYTATTYSLSIQSGAGGSVSYDGTTITNTTRSFTVAEGTSATITISPNSGYRLSRLTVNGTNVTSSVSNNKYTINNITTNTSVVVAFEQIPVTTYSLSIQSGAGGSVSYDGTTVTNKTQSFTVAEGTSATITISPNSGYRLSRLTVNGTNVTSSVSNNQYTISNITANTTVVATFEQIPATTYSLSIQSGAGGSVSYDGTTVTNTTRSFTVNEGTSATITITPNTGYKLSKLTVNGTNVTSSVSNNKYTINSISANMTVVVTFVQITYTLSVQATGNGTVTYNSTATKNNTNSFTVNHGSSATLTISADNGYRLASLKVNGTNVTSSVSNNQYTISSITANTTVVASFEQIPATTYSLSIQSGAGGSVSYDGTTITNKTQSFTIAEGSSVTIEMAPNSGYKLASLVVNGTDVTSGVENNQYTISNITTNTTVVVTFKAIPQTISVDGINYEVRSATDYTLNVGKGNYSGHVVIPATVSYDGDTWTVAGVVDGAFNLSAITAITWNPNTAIGNGAFGAQTNPNLLLYVKSEAYAPTNVQNVIANGRARKIVLTDAASGNDFNCPEAFTAEEISYTHRYGMTTGIGECRGWETIALPFDVKQFTHESKGTLIPFKVFSSTSAGKPFWLYRLTASGWQEAANIEANTPYIISLPNNKVYDNDYNLPGVMTFSSNNVTVPVTEVVRSTFGDRTFVANFTSQASSWSIYALNVNNDYSTYSDYLPEGSTFIRELRTVHPFEAYMTNSSGNAKQFFPLFETLPTAIREIPMQGMRGVKGVRIYSMSGELIMFDENISIEETLKRLKRGVYFVNGKKMVVNK